MIRIPVYDFIAKQIVNIIIVTLVVAAAAFTLTNNYIVTDFFHDFIYIALAIYFRKDKHLLIVLVFMLLGRIVAQVVLYFPLNSFDFLEKCAFYCLVCCCFYTFRKDKLALFSLALLFCMITSEIYWWIIEYKNIPEILYYAVAIATDLIVRAVVLRRSLLLGVKPYLSSIRLFLWQVYTLTGTYTILLSLMIFEYIVRHTLKIQILIIYDSYSYVMVALNTLVLWSVLNYTLKKISFFQA